MALASGNYEPAETGIEVDSPEELLVADVQQEWAKLKVENEAVIRLISKQYHADLVAKGASDLDPYQPDNDFYEDEDLSQKHEFLKNHLTGKVLDIGSGGVDELKGIVADNDVVYTDVKPFQQKNFVQADARQLPFADKTFDSLYSSETITSDSIDEFFPEMLRVLKEKGEFVLRCSPGSIEGVLKFLRERGYDIEKQCTVAAFNTVRQHKLRKDVKFNLTAAFLTVKL
jgi:SAM-dependent methyltransferase